MCPGIRQLQLILLKVALLLGVEVHVNVEFKNLLEPPENQHKQSKNTLKSLTYAERSEEPGVLSCTETGWRLQVHPKAHPVNQLQFDIVVGADGRRNTFPGAFLNHYIHIFKSFLLNHLLV